MERQGHQKIYPKEDSHSFLHENQVFLYQKFLTVLWQLHQPDLSFAFRSSGGWGWLSGWGSPGLWRARWGLAPLGSGQRAGQLRNPAGICGSWEVVQVSRQGGGKCRGWGTARKKPDGLTAPGHGIMWNNSGWGNVSECWWLPCSLQKRKIPVQGTSNGHQMSIKWDWI